MSWEEERGSAAQVIFGKSTGAGAEVAGDSKEAESSHSMEVRFHTAVEEHGRLGGA